MKSLVKVALISVAASTWAMNVYACDNHHHAKSYKGESSACCDTGVIGPHWYVAGNVGLSRVYDNPAQNSGDHVNEYGPGWDATLGYQFTRIFGGEAGYTQYYNSRETFGATMVAKTTHFIAHLNAVGRLPVYKQFDVMGKLGIAYQYAQKVFTGGAYGTASTMTPYFGLGVAYEVTPRANLVGQWTFARGNDETGSNTLYSIGVEYALA